MEDVVGVGNDLQRLAHHRQAVAAHLRLELGLVREPDHRHAARHARPLGRQQVQRPRRLAELLVEHDQPLLGERMVGMRGAGRAVAGERLLEQG